MLSDSLKVIIYNHNQSLFELLNFEDDRTFTEPMLFAYFNSKASPKPSLEQILWGYIDQKEKLSNFEVLTDKNGAIYLPSYGYLLTNSKEQLIDFKYRNDKIQLSRAGQVIDFKFESLSCFLNSPIEMFKYSTSLLDPYFVNEDGSQVEVKFLEEIPCMEEFVSALDAVKKANPSYYEYLLLTIRAFYFYNGEPNSFATLSAHGIAFLNIQSGSSTIFFFDNIVHQCGHIIFNVISYEKNEWFNVSPDTPLNQLNKGVDSAEIYSRYHGLFTQSNVNRSMDRALEMQLFEGEELFELLGRFSSNMNRFRIALQTLRLPDVYSDIGNGWYQYFEDTYQSLYEKRKDVLEAFVVNNQPYVFSYEIFKQSNSKKRIQELELWK